jgi:uncharacterized membrane protein (UPF0127 family)
MIRLSMIRYILAIIFCLLATSLYAADIFSFSREAVQVDGRQFKVLVADTPEKREQGLSNTDPQSLKRRGIDGMLFVFENQDEKTFQAWYMKYDLIVLGLNKISDKSYTVTGRKILRIGTVMNIKGRYVLEIPLLNNSLAGGGK